MSSQSDALTDAEARAVAQWSQILNALELQP